MASDSEAEVRSKKDKKEKKPKDKKDKKEKKRSDTDGVHKDSSKRDKKRKDKAEQEKLARALDAHLQAEVAAEAAEAADAEKGSKHRHKGERKQRDAYEGEEAPRGALVYFAHPMADEKTHKKIFKLIKKGAKIKAIHRGVKECEKAIKKTQPRSFNVSTPEDVPGVLIIAGDISPPEVIEHFPVHCEDHNVPYVFVRSRADLGVAACTKRATSVVLVRPEGKKPKEDGKKKSDKDGEEAEDKDGGKVDPEEFREAWTDLVKLAQREWVAQVLPFVEREKAGY